MSSLSPSKSKNPPLPLRPPAPALEALNPEQREAVLATGGPLFILAGAGTGKTRVIAHRIAHLLTSRPELTPANILALAFSRKAAQAMLERVEGLLGSCADDLGVFTFHGFCYGFLQDHALQLGLPGRLRLLDSTHAWIFFRRLLPELKLKQTWNPADPTECIAGFLKFISRAKDELISPEEYAAHARALSDPHERQRQMEVARAYRLYQQRMRESGALDFGDLIVETRRVLEQKTALLKQVRKRYPVILVDEFQDTNVAQIALLKLLAGPEGNLCVVGDDDQAIYRFRGASFASFLLLQEAIPQVRTFRLTRNYRSTPTILSVTERLIRHNDPDRYDPDKRLWTENPAGPAAEVVVCQDEFHEAQAVVETIRRIFEGMEEPQRRWDRIAVLYRAHAHRERLVEQLRAAGVPFSVRGGSALLQQPEIRDLIALLRVLEDPSDSVSLFRLLSHPAWGIPVEDLVAVNRSAKERQVPLHAVLADLSSMNLPAASGEGVRQFLQELERLRRQALSADIGELAERIAEESFLRINFRLPLVEAAPGASAHRPPRERSADPLVSLGQFLRLTYRYVQNFPGERDLSSFLWYLDCLERMPSPDFAEEESEPGDGVRLMTVHQAKGLEFDWVILLEMVQGRFPARGRPEAIPFPVELMREPLPKGDHHLQEERRLCYVACTRAKRGLFLMTQERDRHRPSPFIREMLEGAAPEEIKRRSPELSPDALPVPSLRFVSLAAEREVLELFGRLRRIDPSDLKGAEPLLARIAELAASQREKPVAWRPQIPARVEGAERFSFTQMETYRYCPLKYLYAYVYRIPVRPTPQMAFGIDLHDCLERFFQQVIEGRVPPLEELLESFRRMRGSGRYGEPIQEEEYRRLGEEILGNFYRRHEGKWVSPVFVEKAFSLQMGDVLVHGVMDRVDPLDEGGVEIVDYKSGKPKEKADFGEQLQLWLYALAAQEVFRLEPVKVSFYYLRNNTRLSFDRQADTLEETRRQILQIAGEIRSSSFDPTPSEFKCRRCDFRNLCPASMA